MITFCLPLLMIFCVLLHHSNSQSCTVRQIIFSDDGRQLYVRFNTKVDTTTILDNPSSCDNYFDTESIILLSDSNCSFSSQTESNTPNSTLFIDLSSNATIQPDTEDLTLVANAFQCENIAKTLSVEHPETALTTTIVIDQSISQTIGSCDTFTISAFSSIGIPYRVYDWIWIVRNGKKSQRYNTGQIAELTLQPIDIPFAGQIVITIQVFTYLGTSGYYRFEVTKSDLPSPDIDVLGPTEWIYSEPLTYIVQISHTACSFDDTLYTFDINCESNVNAITKAMIQHSNQFYIPSGLMLVGNTYIFTCEASSKDGVLVGTNIGTLSVNIVSGSVIAAIAGGNIVTLTRNPLVLDSKSLSYSWSNIGGSIENANIKWNCTSLGDLNRRRSMLTNDLNRRLLQMSTTTFITTATCACPSVLATESVLNIPENTLQSGCFYRFDVDIDNGDNIDSDSIIVEAIENGLSVSIWRDNYCINENNDIELRAVIQTDIESNDVIQIDQYFWQEPTNYLDIKTWDRLSDKLIIPKNTLDPLVTYTFSLSVTITTTTTTSTIDIIVNEKPKILLFDVIEDNNNDATIEQTYTLYAQSESDYKPNQYQFFWRYNNDTLDETNNVALTSKISSHTVNNIYLPEGDLILSVMVFDLCHGEKIFVKYITVNHNLNNITCTDFYNSIVQPLFITAAAVKDYNRVLNIFDITTITIKHLNLQSYMNNNITTSPSPSKNCFSDIIDSFSSALDIVTSDLDSCIEDTIILQKHISQAINLVDDISQESNNIFGDIVDKIWSGCDHNHDTIKNNKLPLCNNITQNETKCINKPTIFSGILTPDFVFRGEKVTQQQITIRLALMDSILASSSLTCKDIKSTLYNIFSLLETIVASNFPGDTETTFISRHTNKLYEGFVKRVKPQTIVDIVFSDGDHISITQDVTISGRETFSSYSNGELDSVDIFAIKIKQDLLKLCQDELIPNALNTDKIFESNNENANKCGEILTDVYLIEIDMDGNKSNLADNITYSFYLYALCGVVGVICGLMLGKDTYGNDLTSKYKLLLSDQNNKKPQNTNNK
eukprot:344992_1